MAVTRSETIPVGSRVGLTPRGGVLAIAGAKVLDAATTGVGLTVSPRVNEGNPLMVAVFDAVGVVPGLLLVTVGVVAAVTATTEFGVAVLGAPPDGPSERTVRAIGYGAPAVLSLGVGVYNLGVLLVIAVA